MFGFDIEIGKTANLSRSQQNDAMKDAFYFIARLWRSKYLPLHFGERATQRYGYTKRKGADYARGAKLQNTYSARKYRLVGHTRPLEFTGDSKRQALQNENITATKSKAIVRLPKGFNRRASESRVRMADEIRTIRPDEATHLQTQFKRRLLATLRAMGARRATVKATLASVD